MQNKRATEYQQTHLNPLSHCAVVLSVLHFLKLLLCPCLIWQRQRFCSVVPQNWQRQSFWPIVPHKWHCKCDLDRLVTRPNYHAQTLASTYKGPHDQPMQASRPQSKQHFDCSTANAFDFELHAQVLAAEASTSSSVLPLEGQHVTIYSTVSRHQLSMVSTTWAFLRGLHNAHEDSSQTLQRSPPVGSYAKHRLVSEVCQTSCSCCLHPQVLAVS